VAEHPKPKQRTRADWGAAKAFYVGLGPVERSYARVGREFRVSSVTVRKHAHREGWEQAALDADQSAAATALRAAFRNREANTSAVLKLRDLAVDASTTEIEGGASVRLADVAALVKVGELLLGEATDRTALMDQGEVQEALGVLMQLSLRFVPKESHGAFIAAVRDLLGGAKVGELEAA